MAELSDQALIARVTVFGNRRAFDTLVCRHQSPLRRFLQNLTGGDSSLADDLAQETFIKAWTQLANFKNKSSFETWLFRIAYNVFYDYIRALKESQSIDDVEREVENLYHQNADDGSIKADVTQALGRLNPKERECIVLFFMEERQIKEIAEITGMPEGTVKSHLSRGKEKMTAFLKQNGYG